VKIREIMSRDPACCVPSDSAQTVAQISRVSERNAEAITNAMLKRLCRWRLQSRPLAHIFSLGDTDPGRNWHIHSAGHRDNGGLCATDFTVGWGTGPCVTKLRGTRRLPQWVEPVRERPGKRCGCLLVGQIFPTASQKSYFLLLHRAENKASRTLAGLLL
jgi:hypothetical protein